MHERVKVAHLQRPGETACQALAPLLLRTRSSIGSRCDHRTEPAPARRTLRDAAEPVTAEIDLRARPTSRRIEPPAEFGELVDEVQVTGFRPARRLRNGRLRNVESRDPGRPLQLELTQVSVIHMHCRNVSRCDRRLLKADAAC